VARFGSLAVTRKRRAAGLDLPILYAPVGVDAARALATDFGNEPLHRAQRSKARCHPRCFRPLKAVQITLIGDAEFVVPADPELAP
jgi:hypothetical protein